MSKLAYILIAILVLIVGFYLLSGMILGAVSERAIDYIMESVKVPSIRYTRPSFDSVRFSSFNAVTWYGISAEATMVKDGSKNVGDSISAKIKEFTIKLGDISERTIYIIFKGLSAEKKNAPGTSDRRSRSSGDRVEAGDLEVGVKLDAFTLSGMVSPIRTLSEELKKFTETGVTKIPIQFEAKETFIIRGSPLTVRIKMQHEGDEYRLVIDENSLRRIGTIVGKMPPTSGDVKIIARNPLRAARLLAISDKAETASAASHKANPRVSEDAYRHTLWSYLLTKEYGKEFAKKVTDAHESESDEEEVKNKKSFMEASYQDFNNNAMGRSYAVRGYPESSILNRVMTDPAIIRDNEMTERYNPADLARYRSRIR